MENPKQRLRPWKRGDAFEAEHLQQAVGAIERITGGIIPPRQIFRTLQKTRVNIKQFRFKTLSIEDNIDYLIAKPWDGTTELDEQVRIALPYLNRQTPFNNLSYNGDTYTYDNSLDIIELTRTNDATGNITPYVLERPYVLNDIIYAVDGVVGGVATEAVIADEVTLLDWQDLNIDGRQWIVKPTVRHTFIWDEDNQGVFTVNNNFVEFVAGVGGIARLGTVAAEGSGNATKELSGLIANSDYRIEAWLRTDSANNSPINTLRLEIGDIDFTLNQNIGTSTPKVIFGSVRSDADGKISFDVTGEDGVGGDGLETSHVFLTKIIGEA